MYSAWCMLHVECRAIFICAYTLFTHTCRVRPSPFAIVMRLNPRERRGERPRDRGIGGSGLDTRECHWHIVYITSSCSHWFSGTRDAGLCISPIDLLYPITPRQEENTTGMWCISKIRLARGSSESACSRSSPLFFPPFSTLTRDRKGKSQDIFLGVSSVFAAFVPASRFSLFLSQPSLALLNFGINHISYNLRSV